MVHLREGKCFNGSNSAYGVSLMAGVRQYVGCLLWAHLCQGAQNLYHRGGPMLSPAPPSYGDWPYVVAGPVGTVLPLRGGWGAFR